MKIVVLSLCVVCLAGSASATALIGRSGSVLKPNQFFTWANFGFNKWAKAYDWPTRKYITPANFLARTTVSCDVLLSYGLPSRFDIGGLVPIVSKSQGAASSFGIGDITLIARYGILSGSKLPLKAALAVGANLPMAAKSALPPLGDRTFDIGLAASGHTLLEGPFTGHARLGYWFNGKPDSVTRYGRMLEYAVILDYAVTPTVIPELAVSGLSQSQTEVRARPVANTEVSQHVVNVLLL